MMRAVHDVVVTVLYAQLSAGDALYARYGDGAADAMYHARVASLRAAVTAQGGREAASTDGAIMAVFPSAVQAVRAAAEMQRGMHPGREALGLRAGLDAGEPIAEDDDIYGTR